MSTAFDLRCPNYARVWEDPETNRFILWFDVVISDREDLWDCIVEECQKDSINNRINILYFLDSLCEASMPAKSLPSTLGHGVQPDSSFYVDYVGRDLSKIVEFVIPEGHIGLPNLTSTKQILEDWGSKRAPDPQKVDDALEVESNTLFRSTFHTLESGSERDYSLIGIGN